MTHKTQLGFEIRTVHNLIKREVAKTKPPELDSSTGVHGWVIHYFYENRTKDIFQKDFEERFSIRRSTATNMLNLMETNGLIIREKVDYDARLKKITLTQKAIEIHNQIEKNIELIENKISAGISDEEYLSFISTLQKIKANLEVDHD